MLEEVCDVAVAEAEPVFELPEIVGVGEESTVSVVLEGVLDAASDDPDGDGDVEAVEAEDPDCAEADASESEGEEEGEGEDDGEVAGAVDAF